MTEALVTAMQALKAATNAQHDKLESIANARAIMSPDVTPAHFARLMQGHYQLHWLLETSLAQTLDAHLPALRYGSERCKLDLLEQDLRELGFDPQALRPDQAPRSVQGLEAAIGIAYVLEGSTLGGNVIRRSLQRHLKLSRPCEFHYYACYGEALGERWQAFAACANQALKTPAQQDLACEAARETFELACQLFAQPQAVPERMLV